MTIDRGPAIPVRAAAPSFAEAFRFWLKLGLISFGGPTGQIAIMHQEIVEKRRWISEQQFLHALNFCMLLPGPEAQQLATYIGWLLHGIRGGLAAGLLFILPAILLLWGLSVLYVFYASQPALFGVLAGLKAAVLAIVLLALIRLALRALNGARSYAIAACAFMALYFWSAPFPLVVLSAALVGYFAPRPSPLEAALENSFQRPSGRAAALKLLAGLVLWWGPILAALLALGAAHSVSQAGVFFGQTALITFGGAYAVLPYVAQKAVEHFHWLTQAQMIDGLGLAETTPGPLIMVLQFVGFLAGYQNPGALQPLYAATLGALITTWATFAPCFVFIFVGAPYIEYLRHKQGLAAALAAVTAAVVGVIANLTVWMGQHVLFTDTYGIQMTPLFVMTLSVVALKIMNLPIPAVVLGAGLFGYLLA